jgi:UDP-N-acetylglucosamine:LPS N-acetylglucosamine transferase
MILVPLTEATRGDQVENARLLEREGAALVFSNAEANPVAILTALRSLLMNEGHRTAMAAAARKFAGADAASLLATAILQQIKGGKLS